MQSEHSPVARHDKPLWFSSARSLRGELGWLFALLGLALLMTAGNGFLGLYQYRRMVGDLRRVEELPAAAELNRAVGDLRIAVAEHLQRQRWAALQAGGRTSPGLDAARSNVCKRIDTVREELAEYLDVLRQAQGAAGPLAQTYKEKAVAREMAAVLDALQREYHHPEPAPVGAQQLCDRLQHLAGRLPAILQRRLNDVPDQMRNRYRWQIQAAWSALVAVAVLLGLFLWRFSRRVLVPLRSLIHGARLIAQGKLDVRFDLPGRDEMSQLARLLNRMIEQFLHTRDRLDDQVQRLAEQKMRNERLAVVGLLAAGVGRQIEPSLRQITQAAQRLHQWSQTAAAPAVEDEVLQRLRHIQSGAFACKRITQQLLQLARENHQAPQPVELNQLVSRTLETWRSWHAPGLPVPQIRWSPGPPAQVSLALQEFRIALLALLRGLTELALPGSLRLQLEPAAQRVNLRIDLALSPGTKRPEKAFGDLVPGSYCDEPSWLSLAAAMFAESQIRLRYQLRETYARVELDIPCHRPFCLPGDAA